ncbi:MAG: sulfotransferase domain-containing protein [Magnetococcales bacterium]|nr:sulfotransferase domain-containing protein [Magnetococcales bacterium]
MNIVEEGVHVARQCFDYGAVDMDLPTSCRQFLSLDPYHVEGAILMADLALETGPEAYPEAIEHVSRALTQHRDVWRLYDRLGDLLRFSGRLPVAQFHYDKALELGPTNPETIYKSARLRFLRGILNEAEALLKHSLTLDVHHAPSQLLISLVHQAQTATGDASFTTLKELEAMQGALLGDNGWQGSPFVEGTEPNQEAPRTFACMSHPKCGTHLLNDVMLGLSGLDYSWTRDDDVECVNERMPALTEENQYVIGHWWAGKGWVSRMQEEGSRGVIQYRDPRDQLVSYYYFCRDVTENDPHSEMLRSLPEEEAIRCLINGFNEQAMGNPTEMGLWLAHWIRADVPTYLSSFERMIHDKPQTVAEIGRFTGYPKSRAQCDVITRDTAFNRRSKTVEEHNLSEKGFKRKGKSGDWRNHFSLLSKRRFKKSHGELLMLMGYEKDLAW